MSFTVTAVTLWSLCFFLWRARISLRPRITKKTTCVFSPSARIGLLLISETPSLFQEMKKHFSSYVFWAVFFVAIINFFKIDNFFFIWSPSLTFSKIGSIFFFLTVFSPSLIRCWIFYDLNQRNKTLWPVILNTAKTKGSDRSYCLLAFNSWTKPLFIW